MQNKQSIKKIRILSRSTFLGLSVIMSMAFAQEEFGKINGISFENWAAANAHIAGGMPPEEVYKILNISEKTWDSVSEKWVEKMAQTASGDMSMSIRYSEIFANPQVGKFANSQAITSQEELLKKVPDYDAYRRIWTQMTKADLEKETVLSDNNLSLQEWGALNVYYSKWLAENLSENRNPETVAYIKETDEKWEKYWSDYYKK